MLRSDFTANAPGRLIDNLDGRLTFLPDPLPGDYRLDHELMSLVSDAQGRLCRVDGVAGTLPNPRLILRTFIRREAQISSKIENVAASYRDLAEADVATPERRREAVREILRNEEALHFALDAVTERGRPLTLSLIRETHAVLLADEPRKKPGEFRGGQVYLGGESNRIEDAVFVPPPSGHVRDAMEALDDYLHRPDDVPPIVKNAMVHYQFETIHPFNDGNGRLGRALILVMLCTGGLLRLPTLNPSLYMERNRPEYYRRLREVSQQNKWTAWIKFFARSLAAAADDALKKIDAIRTLHDEYRSRVQKPGRSGLTLKLVDELFVRQAVTVPLAVGILGLKDYDTAARHVRRLEKLGILREVTGQKTNKVYLAEEIIELIQR